MVIFINRGALFSQDSMFPITFFTVYCHPISLSSCYSVILSSHPICISSIPTY